MRTLYCFAILSLVSPCFEPRNLAFKPSIIASKPYSNSSSREYGPELVTPSSATRNVAPSFA